MPCGRAGSSPSIAAIATRPSAASADFEVNTKAEREIEAILRHLEHQNDLILRILGHLEGTAISKG
jgi:hypothetical protein